MQVKYRESFEKDLNDISSHVVLDAVFDAIENVKRVKKPPDITGIKKMKGNKYAFRIRIGRFRIGIYNTGGSVEFCRVLSRDKIYLYFPQ